MAEGNLQPDELSRLIAELRPALHRYCARMMGSAFDGEDVVQDALVKAAVAWPTVGDLERPQSWLFRIAHTTSLDALRHRRRQARLRARLNPEFAREGADARVAATASLATLMRLSAAQRSCVVLVDVLGHSLDETTAILAVSLPAAKAALHRGRRRLQALAVAEDLVQPRLDPDMAARLRAYADRFNAQDFDALRALLAEDVRLDLVERTGLSGARDVGVYFTRYAQASFRWRMAPGLVEGRPAMLVSDPADPTDAVLWVVLLDWADERIAAIRDFHFARYRVEGVAFTRL